MKNKFSSSKIIFKPVEYGDGESVDTLPGTSLPTQGLGVGVVIGQDLQ